MNQLLASCDDHVIVGLKDRIFVSPIASNTGVVLELGRNQDEENEANNNKLQKSAEELQEIQSVAIYQMESLVYCAVGRGDKTLSLYKFTTPGDEKGTLLPYLVYDTSKRIGCLCFTEFPGTQGSEIKKPVLIAGDMGGDAYAYDLQKKGRRLLLGHTATMLTDVCVYKNMLLTADRDEKIRVSQFPGTHFIEGFLLGHEEYITAMDSNTSSKDPNKILVVSCGGDKSLRLWNVENFEQISMTFLEETNKKRKNDTEDQPEEKSSIFIPTDVAIDGAGSHVAVIFDQSMTLQVFRIIDGESNEKKFVLVESIECPSQPLGVSFQMENIIVLLREPQYIVSFSVKEDTVVSKQLEGLENLRERAASLTIKMPDCILEKDKHGNPKLRKLEETRGPSGPDVPWNRVERIDIAKERGKRHKKRKAEKTRSEATS